MADIATASKNADPINPVDDKEQVTPNDEYAHGTRLTAIIVSLLLGLFLVALDNVGDA